MTDMDMRGRLSKDFLRGVDEELTQIARAAFAEASPLVTFLRERNEFKFDGVSKLVLETQQLLANPAVDAPVKEGPTFRLVGLPLPFTHADFPLRSQARARAVDLADLVEQTVVHGGPRIGGCGIAGLTSAEGVQRFPARMGCRQVVEEMGRIGFFGPFLLLLPDKSWKGPLELSHQIQHVAVNRWLVNPLLVCRTPDVLRIVVGLDVTVVKWKEGWKVVTIMVPQVRSDWRVNAGIAELIP